MKGIILAGGHGTRLHPVTMGISKQLLPIYDKPMIYYPLSVLMLAGIRDILIITTPHDQPYFQKLLGDGHRLGVNLEYQIQETPDGLPQAFILAETFIGADNVCLILGDNIFYGQFFRPLLLAAANQHQGATIFTYRVDNPSSFGVVEFDKNDNVVAIKEKPKKTNSNYALTGLYFFDNNVIKLAKELVPSERGELEITDLINRYLQQNQLSVEQFGRGFAWLDTGTYDNLLEASSFVRTIEQRQGLKIACPEEIAYYNGWLTKEEIIQIAEAYKNNNYGSYLLSILQHRMPY